MCGPRPFLVLTSRQCHAHSFWWLISSVLLLVVSASNSISIAQAPTSAQVKMETKSSKEEVIHNHPLLHVSEISITGEKSATLFNRLQDERQWAVFELERIRANMEHYRTKGAPRPEIVELLDQQNYEAEL